MNHVTGLCAAWLLVLGTAQASAVTYGLGILFLIGWGLLRGTPKA